MIVRIVRMKFENEHCQEFIDLFWKTRPGILEFEGCRDVKLLQSESDPQILTTFSIWESTKHLDHYRFSEFFKKTWSTIKPWMIEKAEATSYIELPKP